MSKYLEAILNSRNEPQYNACRSILRTAVTEVFDGLLEANKHELNAKANEVAGTTYKQLISSMGKELMEAILVAVHRTPTHVTGTLNSPLLHWGNKPKGIPDGSQKRYAEMVEQTLEAYKLNGTAQQTTTQSNTPTTQEENFTVTIPTLALDKANPQMLAAINAMLANTLPAYEGEALSIERIEAMIQENSKAAQEAGHQVAKLTRELQNAKSAAPVVIQPTAAGIPTGKTRMYNAAELFKHPTTGAKHPMLNFDVPGYEWDGSHPYVPALDPDYEFDVSHLIAGLSALVLNQNVWAWGHTGTGKTTLFEQIAARLQWPVTRFNLDSGIERTDLIGQTVLEEQNGTTVSTFKPGPLVEAMKAGHIILLDEMDFVRPDTAYALQRALESKGLLLTENGGELVVPSPMTRFVATANTRGQGDESGLYQGARVQSTALLNRFSKWLKIGYITLDAEIRLLGKKFSELDSKYHKQIANFAAEMRQSFLKEQTSIAFSPRNSMALAQTLSFYLTVMQDAPTAIEAALSHTVIEGCAERDANVVGEIRMRTFA